ncbi:hypothetical protein B5F35_10210 [Anaeromassilibacillus sp. An200]|nr:hypothetical protein B5F35_10210 [Anaeromassilibacillus sp. An200]
MGHSSRICYFAAWVRLFSALFPAVLYSYLTSRARGLQGDCVSSLWIFVAQTCQKISKNFGVTKFFPFFLAL